MHHSSHNRCKTRGQAIEEQPTRASSSSLETIAIWQFKDTNNTLMNANCKAPRQVNAAGSCQGRLLPCIRRSAMAGPHPRTAPHLCHSVASQVEAPSPVQSHAVDELNQSIREGHYEKELVDMQASKPDDGQQPIASVLPRLDASTTQDVVVVGCGPAGMYLAYHLSKRGAKVALIGRDVPLVNNYGVWLDEFKELGFEDTLDCSWPDVVNYFGEGNEVKVRHGAAARDATMHVLPTSDDASSSCSTNKI